MRFPKLAARLYRLLVWHVAIENKPDFIVGDPGDPYLQRWFIIPRNPLINIYLHRFLRSDDDRALHDHPWPSISLALSGGCIEHTIAAGGIHNSRVIFEGDIKFRSHRFAHRIEMTPFEEFWTLFITGPRLRRWGFHCPEQGWIDFERFTKPGATGQTGAGCDG